MRLVLLISVLMLAACGGSPKSAIQPASNALPAVAQVTPQIPPVQFGLIPPGMPMTSDNMPVFDIVIYCRWQTHTTQNTQSYESCAEDQQHANVMVGDALDRGQFSERAVLRCAKASRAAYEGMWYCLNGRDFDGERITSPKSAL